MDDAAPTATAHTARGLKTAVLDIAFGSAAGMISKVFEHPFDLTKVRLQTQVLDHQARFSGPIDCLRQTYTKEGIRGLYRGLPAPIVGAMAENASLFLAYNEVQSLIRHFNHQAASTPLTLPELAVAGAGAGAVTSFLLTPIELVKCKMQVQMLVAESAALAGGATQQRSFSTMEGPIGVLRTVIRTTGWRGLWLGQTGTFIRETGGGAAWFASNEFVSRLFIARRAAASGQDPATMTKRDLGAFELGLAGAASGVTYNLALFPADSVKSTMQTEDELRPGTVGPKRTFFGTFRAMYRAGGIRALYAGCGITVARAIPSSALIFIIYDGLTTRFA
ncbi:mitochondrial carrier [Auriculariales sp. MPI-PUGE-AT-0066]|nr:mitochondrial carrier [Auriculariales sp. MPI-PUGE-AT-0066]